MSDLISCSAAGRETESKNLSWSEVVGIKLVISRYRLTRHHFEITGQTFSVAVLMIMSRLYDPATLGGKHARDRLWGILYSHQPINGIATVTGIPLFSHPLHRFCSIFLLTKLYLVAIIASCISYSDLILSFWCKVAFIPRTLKFVSHESRISEIYPVGPSAGCLSSQDQSIALAVASMHSFLR